MNTEHRMNNRCWNVLNPNPAPSCMKHFPSFTSFFFFNLKAVFLNISSHNYRSHVSVDSNRGARVTAFMCLTELCSNCCAATLTRWLEIKTVELVSIKAADYKLPCLFTLPIERRTVFAYRAGGLKDPVCISGIRSQWQARSPGHFDVAASSESLRFRDG